MALKDLVENIRNVGDSMSNFSGEGTPVEKPEAVRKVEGDKHMKNIRVGSITISIKAYSGKDLTRLEDTFNLHLDYDEKHDNTKVLMAKLENIKLQAQKLVDVWTREVE
jgi:hypothetical protein